MNPSQLIRNMFEVIDANDFDALCTCVDREIVYERPGFERVAGRDALLNFYRHVRVIRSGRHVLDTIVVDGDTAMSSGRFTGVQKDGTPVDIQFSELYRLAADRTSLVFRRTYFFQRAV